MNTKDNNELRLIVDCITDVADALDGLADLGVTMVKARNSSIARRPEIIEKLTATLQASASQLGRLIEHLELDPNLKDRVMSSINASSQGLASAFETITQSNDLVGEDCETIITYWVELRDLIERLVLTLQLESQPWYEGISKRRPAYEQQLRQLLP